MVAGCYTGAVETRRLSSDEFRDVIGHFATGVTIITARRDGAPVGTTASAVCSLSLEPPMMLVCLNRASATGQTIGVARSFAVNILGEGQGELALRFATKADDRFAGVELTSGPGGEPLLADALAHLECRVTEATTGGTHTVFLAEVEYASARGGAPLAYFRGRFGRLELRRESPLTAEAVRDALHARGAIELGAAALTVGRVAADDLVALRRLSEAAASGDVAGWPAADAAFHEHLVALAGSEALLDSYRRLDAGALVARALAATGAGERPPEGEHAAIVAAYERGDLDAASHAIRRDAEHTIEHNRRRLEAVGAG